jgi:hypothetical protein
MRVEVRGSSLSSKMNSTLFEGSDSEQLAHCAVQQWILVRVLELENNTQRALEQ